MIGGAAWWLAHRAPAPQNIRLWKNVFYASRTLGWTHIPPAPATSKEEELITEVTPEGTDQSETPQEEAVDEEITEQASRPASVDTGPLGNPPWIGGKPGPQGGPNLALAGPSGAVITAPAKPSFIRNPIQTPPYQPNPNLIGSPKIQTPGTPSGGAPSAGTESTPPAPAEGTAPEATGKTTPPPSGEAPGRLNPEGTKVALEGTLGSTVESAVLPGFDAVYITLPGQNQGFDKYSMDRLDFNIWQMSEPAQLYCNSATARYYSERTYLDGDQPGDVPPPPTCSTENIDPNFVKITCNGDFPFVDGHLLRVISCGPPNQEILDNFVGRYPTTESKLAAFLGRAWLQGDTGIWDQDLCPDRQYLDYPFQGAVAPLVGVLQAGWVYFIAQFPTDYIVPGDEAKTAENMNLYGPPVLVSPGVELGRYETSRAMNKFLYDGSIVQVVVAKQPSDPSSNLTQLQEVPPGCPEGEYNYTNVALGDLIEGRFLASAPTEGVPTNAWCQAVSGWEDPRKDMENTLIDLVNQARKQGANCGVQGSFAGIDTDLIPNATLRCAARAQSQDMSVGDFFSHFNSDPNSPHYLTSELNRIFAAGTDPLLPNASPAVQGTLFGNGGENIAKGITDPHQVIQEWLQSPGHCANMMNPSFTHLGAGYVPTGEGGPYWTLTLGTPWQ